jgi:hypothetical protein
MPYKKEEDDDLFEDDFEFVDDEDDDEEDEEDEDEYEDEDDEEEEDSELDEKPAAKPKRGAKPTPAAKEPAPPKGRGKAAPEKPAPRGRGKAAPEKPAPAPRPERAPAPRDERVVDEEPEVEEVAAESEAPPEPVGPPANHVVHIYEFRKFKRTLARDFTSDDADKFAVEYNRTAASHSRWAVSGNKDDQPTPKI